MLGAAGRVASGLVKSATAVQSAVKTNIPAVAARKYLCLHTIYSAVNAVKTLILSYVILIENGYFLQLLLYTASRTDFSPVFTKI